MEINENSRSIFSKYCNVLYVEKSYSLFFKHLLKYFSLIDSSIHSQFFVIYIYNLYAKLHSERAFSIRSCRSDSNKSRGVSPLQHFMGNLSKTEGTPFWKNKIQGC